MGTREYRKVREDVRDREGIGASYIEASLLKIIRK